MSKFKVNERVMSTETGEVGTVRAREVLHENKRTSIKYLVDFGGGMESWQVKSKKQLSRIPKKNKQRPCIIKEYSYGENQRLVMVASVKTTYVIPTEYFFGAERKAKKLVMGYSIYNGVDEYSTNFGIRYAKHRMKTCPFCHMTSEFGGEFNNETVTAIMDAKANYIKEHWEEFYTPAN